MSRTPLIALLRLEGLRRAGMLLPATAFMLVGVGNLLGGHHCPHHMAPLDGHGPAAAAHEREAHGRALVGPGDAGGQEHDPSGPCTCIGLCHGSASAPVPAVASVFLAGSGAWSLSEGTRPSGPRVVRLLPYVLPFANAPPGSS